MTFEAMQTALVDAAYTALGQTVTYTPSGATGASIQAIVDNSSDLFGIGSETAEGVSRARVKVSDVTQPGRGDTITMADATVYIVDSVDIENNAEWLLQMTEDAR